MLSTVDPGKVAIGKDMLLAKKSKCLSFIGSEVARDIEFWSLARPVSPEFSSQYSPRKMVTLQDSFVNILPGNVKLTKIYNSEYL
jgi:hypothetical protein